MSLSPPAARRRATPSESSFRNAIASSAASTVSVSVLVPSALRATSSLRWSICRFLRTQPRRGRPTRDAPESRGCDDIMAPRLSVQNIRYYCIAYRSSGTRSSRLPLRQASLLGGHGAHRGVKRIQYVGEQDRQREFEQSDADGAFREGALHRPSAPQAAGDDTEPGGQQRPPRPLVAVAHRQPEHAAAEIGHAEGDGVASAGRTQLIEQLADLLRRRRRTRPAGRALRQLVQQGGQAARRRDELRSAGAQLVHQGAHAGALARSEEHTSELQSRSDLVCRLLLEKKK